MAVPEGEHTTDESFEVGELVTAVPIDPRRGVVLVVGIVVAALGPSELVAHRRHRRPVGHRQQAPGVAQLSPAQRRDIRRHSVVALEAAVPRAVVTGSIGVVVTVGLVALVVVGDEVVHREPVVARHEVAGLGRAHEQVGAALDPLDERRNETTLAAQEPAHIVAKAVVPLSPLLARPRRAKLVRAGGIPRLGDQRDPPASGPLVEPGDQWPVSAEHRGEVEAETVGAEVGVAVERHDDQVLDDGRRGIDVVAAPGRLDVLATVVEAVVVAVGEAPLAVRRPTGVDLGGVVEDDVDPHLEVAVVGGGDQLGQLGGGIVTGGVLPVHGAEGERHVPPVAALLRIALMHREEFDDAESEGGDAVELADQFPVGAWRRAPGLRRGHAAHVRLVDDRRTAGTPRRAGRRPRRGAGDWAATRVGDTMPAGGRSAVLRGEHHLGRRWIQQYLRRVEPCSNAIGDEAVDGPGRNVADPAIALASERTAFVFRAAVVAELDERDRPGGRRMHPNRKRGHRAGRYRRAAPR